MAELEAIIEQLRAHGERVTIQRRLVVEALCDAEDHLSVNDIEGWLAVHHPDEHLQETTIYRILQWLKGIAFVSQTDMGSTGIVYELLDKRHHHLICLSCGAVIDVDDRYLAPLRRTLDADFGFKARIDHMAIYGLCPICAKKQQNEQFRARE